MSGRKETTITLSESEYRYLREQEWRLRQIQSVLPEVEYEIRSIRHEVGRHLDRVEQRQQRLQQALGQVHADLQQLEAETARRLREHQRQMQEALRDVRREMRELLAEQEERFNEMLAQERRARERQIASLQQQIDALVADARRKAEIAQAWVEAAQTLHDFIEGNYRHRLFRPGALERLARDLRQARENLQQGIAEAALAMAQRAYHDLSDLRLELERLEAEWQLWRTAALESAREILALAHANRTCQAIDLQGRELDLRIEVDWWTDGRLSALEAELQTLLGRLQDEQNPPSLEDLRAIVQGTLPQLRQRLEETIRDARLAVLGSQLRINIADLIAQALEEQGFSIQAATYEGEDMRAGYYVQARHLDGSEVVVVVTPQEGRPLENNLQILSYDVDQRSEDELRHRAAELARALQTRGLQAPAPEKTGDRPDPTLRNIEQIRRRAPRVAVRGAGGVA